MKYFVLPKILSSWSPEKITQALNSGFSTQLDAVKEASKLVKAYGESFVVLSLKCVAEPAVNVEVIESEVEETA